MVSLTLAGIWSHERSDLESERSDLGSKHSDLESERLDLESECSVYQVY